MSQRDDISASYDFQMPSQSIGHGQSITMEFDGNKAQAAKSKLEQHMKTNNMTVSMLFAVLDTNSDKSVDLTEFMRKASAAHIKLDNDELKSLFRLLDTNNSGSITFAELVEQFAGYNTAHIVKAMQGLLAKSKMDPEQYFKQNCNQDKNKNQMTNHEFTKLVKNLYSKAVAIEIAHIYRHFDKGNKGYVTRQDWLHVIASGISETSY